MPDWAYVILLCIAFGLSGVCLWAGLRIGLRISWRAAGHEGEPLNEPEPLVIDQEDTE